MKAKLFSYLLNFLTLTLLIFVALGSFTELISLPYSQELLSKSNLLSIINFILYAWIGTAIISLIVINIAKIFKVHARYNLWVSFYS